MNAIGSQITGATLLVHAILISSIAVASIAPAIVTMVGQTPYHPSIVFWQQTSEHTGLKKFSSHEELTSFIGATYRNRYCYWGEDVRTFPTMPFAAAGSLGSDSDYVRYRINLPTDNPADYSTTNIQVAGVDEADIVKCDGRYIYVVSGSKVLIIYAYPAEGARILSEIGMSESPTEIFVNGNKLVVLGQTFIKVYDISDRENPVLKRDVSFDGSYFNSRLIGDFVYVVINKYAYYWDNVVPLPKICLDGKTVTVPATEIYYFENIWDYCYNFTTIIAINVQNDGEDITSATFLTGASQNIFVSLNNIYLTCSGRGWWPEKTIIHKISVTGEAIEYKYQGEVPGRVLNQFSMDEHQGYFRIATTTGWSRANHVYVLGEDLSIVGVLENLAPGERIYSARFMGTRAYLVTFKQVDPLFVLDLADPTNPRVLGELKIPGYSDYLHPYDETHIMGIGKDTIDAGSFAWMQGVKLSLFDVSDPENPREISKYMIGDRGTEWGDSYALSDHRAFLFSRERNLLVVPIELAERESSDASPWTYGIHVWQGAYVFNISLEEGFVLKGRITHSETGFEDWGYNSDPRYNVRRSLYIDNVLYTISGGLVKMNDIQNLNELNKIELR